MLKLSDYSLRVDGPAEHQVYRGKGVVKSKPLKLTIVNLGSLEDNITLHLEGELMDRGWAYLEATGKPAATYRVAPSKGLAQEVPLEVSIVITPPENAPRRDYILTVRAVSEDHLTTVRTQEISVRVKEAPSDDGEAPLTDDMIDFIRSVLPFLKVVPDGMVLPLFLLFIVLLIVLPIIAVLLLLKRKRDREKAKDPMAERKKLYRELYGKEASEDELRQWEEEKTASEITEGAKEVPAGGAMGPDGGAAGPLKDGEGAEKATGGGKTSPPKSSSENLDKEDKELLDRLFD
jgi:hypothetical protein